MGIINKNLNVTMMMMMMICVGILIMGMMNSDHQFVLAQADHPPPAPWISPLKQRCTNMFNFIKTCALYMHRFSPRFHKPNQICCENARKINISVFCNIFLIREMERIFRPSKVAVIARHCGKPLPRFSRCGSYFVRRIELTNLDGEAVDNYDPATNKTNLELDLAPTV